MELIAGKKYVTDTLRLVGWTEGDGSGHEGYSHLDYFRAGIYLGPDMHGIEPVVEDGLTVSARGGETWAVTLDGEFLGTIECASTDIDDVLDATRKAYGIDEDVPGREVI